MEEAWNLLHEEKPAHNIECYWGFKGRTSEIFLYKGVWDEKEGDWIEKEYPYLHEENYYSWGDWDPMLLPIDIFWCRSEDFSFDKERALASLMSLIDSPSEDA